jgi:LCP family protein required for cell wall assembly
MFVLTVDPRSKTAGILGIPRDLYVEIPNGDGSYYEDRINTAFILGEMEQEGGGKRLAIETVERLLGIEVHHYVIIDFLALGAVDALGGIRVDVPAHRRPLLLTTELPGDYWAVGSSLGFQHMDGAETSLTPHP